jgi:hypothetical protein
MTFGLKSKYGLFVDKHTENGGSETFPMAPIDDIKGHWIQV